MSVILSLSQASLVIGDAQHNLPNSADHQYTTALTTTQRHISVPVCGTMSHIQIVSSTARNPLGNYRAVHNIRPYFTQLQHSQGNAAWCHLFKSCICLACCLITSTTVWFLFCKRSANAEIFCSLPCMLTLKPCCPEEHCCDCDWSLCCCKFAFSASTSGVGGWKYTVMPS